jgi:hyperosmotically inducible protein
VAEEQTLSSASSAHRRHRPESILREAGHFWGRSFTCTNQTRERKSGLREASTMKTSKLLLGFVSFTGLVITQACSTTTKSPDVAGSIHDALKQAGLNDVSVSQDRDKGVVTLKGSVAASNEKAQAEAIAKSLAPGQVVGDEIAVLPPGAESTTKTVNGDLDDGIKKNLDAALIENQLHKDVKYDVKNGVVTLTGEVTSQVTRTAAERTAAAVPNVQQVVNKLDVKNQKATSSNE